MIKYSCVTGEEVSAACNEMREHYLALNKRDTTTPPLSEMEPAFLTMGSLDNVVKKLFITVFRSPRKMVSAPPSVVRYVHETMDFIEYGKARTLNIEEWDTVITMALNPNDTVMKKQLTRGGSQWFRSGIDPSISTLFKPHESIYGANNMSSGILLHKWIQRDQGLKDALISYRLIGQILLTYCP